MYRTRKAYDNMYHAFKAEVLAHKETEEKAERRLEQIQHLLLENAQLQRELDQMRHEYIDV